MAKTNMIIIGLLCSFFCIEIPTVSDATTTNDPDLHSLLDIKKGIQIDPSRVLDSWNDTVHFCDWQGITCGNKRVTSLVLQSLDLVGTLSPSIGNLTFLRDVFLNDNFFYGIIPQEIGSLFRLSDLFLSFNSFEGQIPTNLTACRNLQTFRLSSSKLSGRIPDQLSTLSNLLALELDRNNFTGNIPPSFGNISSLRILDFTYNSLTGNIPYELGKLVDLYFFSLGENKLSGTFPIEMYNISSIVFFWIVGNNLAGQFPDTLGLTLPKMKFFLAGSNYFSGSIPSTLANASDLLRIDFGFNNLTGLIPRNLGRLPHLGWLQFSNNPLDIDGDNDISFITTLTNCTNLVHLDLSTIEIGGILPLEISNLSRKLSFLDLGFNHISGNLPVGIGDLVSLSTLAFTGNTLSGSIPHSIGKLTNLKELFLASNNFIGEIPPSIGDISGLLILDLAQNMLTGTIPLSLRNLTLLLGLDLSQNRLNGSLRKEIFSLTSLSRRLLLFRNNFTGSIPSEVGNLTKLGLLSVSENNLSDEIPTSIGDCVMLVELEMEGNFLNGTIPSSLGQLKTIEFIDLSRNKLTGKIPASLETLKFISFVNLSFNMLEGEVPENGVLSKASVLSVVGNEKLCGGIESLNLPDCPRKDSKKREKLSTHAVIILVVCIPIALVSLFGCTCEIYQTRKSKSGPSSTYAYHENLLRISYAEILASTNCFSSENLIGEGNYGSVYRGVLKPSDTVVAVKVLKLQLKGAHKTFLAECEALRNIRHVNLVKIITSCSSIDFEGNEFKALISEYVPNGSLEAWLHQNPFSIDKKKLDLLERLNIAIDIATALDYLHNHSGNPIVHCDIKPSNVLLDEDLCGLVSDFGLAKFLPTTTDAYHDIESTSIGIRGTIGYVAPEYGMGGDVSPKGDIYSYGILLLEMFTGKRPTDTMFTENFTLRNYVKTALDHHVVEIIDPQLLTGKDNEENKSNNTFTRNIIESCCLSIFRVGVSCSSGRQNERMNIKDALNELQHIRNKT